MVYDTTGKSHKEGVANEHTFVERCNNPDGIICRYIRVKYGVTALVEHKGGTRTVDDAVIMNDSVKVVGISIKRHKCGTFDWLNTSKLTDKDTLCVNINGFRERNRGITKDMWENNEKTLRAECATLFDNYLNTITSENIVTILGNIYKDYCDEIAIVDIGNNRTIMYPKAENFNEMIGYPMWRYYLNRTRAKNSAVIWREYKGVQLSTNLRIRITLNNGVTALLGLSSANKNSCVCLKVQQDNVRGYINSLRNTVIENHERDSVV